MVIPKFEVRNAEVEALLKKLGETLGEACPEGFGFTLLLFSLGEGGSLFYISNAVREDVIRSMEEFIQKFREN